MALSGHAGNRIPAARLRTSLCADGPERAIAHRRHSPATARGLLVGAARGRARIARARARSGSRVPAAGGGGLRVPLAGPSAHTDVRSRAGGTRFPACPARGTREPPTQAAGTIWHHRTRGRGRRVTRGGTGDAPEGTRR